MSDTIDAFDGLPIAAIGIPACHKCLECQCLTSHRHLSSYRQTSLILRLADMPNLEIHIAKVRRQLTHSVSGEGCRQQAIRVVVAPQKCLQNSAHESWQ